MRQVLQLNGLGRQGIARGIGPSQSQAGYQHDEHHSEGQPLTAQEMRYVMPIDTANSEAYPFSMIRAKSQLGRAQEKAHEGPPSDPQIRLVNLLGQNLLAIEDAHAHAHQDEVNHHEAQHNPPQYLVASPEHDDALRLHQEGHGDENETGQKVGRPHAGGLAGHDHRPGDHHQGLHGGQHDNQNKYIERRNIPH